MTSYEHPRYQNSHYDNGQFHSFVILLINPFLCRDEYLPDTPAGSRGIARLYANCSFLCDIDFFRLNHWIGTACDLQRLVLGFILWRDFVISWNINIFRLLEIAHKRTEEKNLYPHQSLQKARQKDCSEDRLLQVQKR